MLSLALGARRKARGDSASWPRQCATSSMRPCRQPSGVSTAYEPLRSRRRQPRHINTTTTPGGRPRRALVQSMVGCASTAD
jgi:hypothetical protein